MAIYTVPSTLSSYITIAGKTVFVYGWGNNYMGTLTSWSSGAAQPGTLSTNALAYLYQTAWASDEAAPHVVYLDGVTYGNSNVYGASPDGTGKTLLVANVDTNASDASCFPRVAFRGGYAVVAYCALTDAGKVPVLRSFAMTSGWAPAVVVNNWIDQYRFNVENLDPSSFPFALDPDGGRVVAASSTSGSGSLQVFPIDGGAGTVLDPSVALTPRLSFAGTASNPWAVYYNTDAGVLEGTPVGTPAPTVLADGGVNYFAGVLALGPVGDDVEQAAPGRVLLGPQRGLDDQPGSSQLIATSVQYGNDPVAMSGSAGGAFTTDEQLRDRVHGHGPDQRGRLGVQPAGRRARGSARAAAPLDGVAPRTRRRWRVRGSRSPTTSRTPTAAPGRPSSTCTSSTRRRALRRRWSPRACPGRTT